jgi:hypothetical protein
MKNNHTPEENSSTFMGKTIDPDILNKNPNLPNEIRGPLPSPIVDDLPKEKPGPNRLYPDGTGKTLPNLDKPTFQEKVPCVSDSTNEVGFICNPPETNKRPPIVEANSVETKFPHLNKPSTPNRLPVSPNNTNIPGTLCHPPENNRKSPSFNVNGVEMSFPAQDENINIPTFSDKTLSDTTNTKIAEASEILQQIKTSMQQRTTDVEVASANNKVPTAQLER